MSWYLFLAPLEGQNIIWVFSNLGVSTSGCLLEKHDVVQIASFCAKLRYLTDQNGPKTGPHQNKLWLFWNNKILQTVSAEKVDEKIGVICLVSMFPTWVRVCILSKKVHFLQLCADLSKKSKSVEAIYIYASENAMLIGVWATVHEILGINLSKKLLTQQKFLKNYLTSNTHTIKTVSQSIINNINFWKCVTRPFRCIYVNCSNQLGFLAEVSTKLKKMHFLDNLRTITQEGSMETRQMNPFCSSSFSSLFVICSNFIFMWSPHPVGPFWSVKYLNLKYPKSHQFRQLITLFYKVDTLRLLTIYIMFCTPTRAKSSFF